MNYQPYRLSNKFELDFWEIQDWLYDHEPWVRTQKTIDSILEKLDYISQNPFAYPLATYPEGDNHEVRKAVHFKTYLIFYVVHIDFVEFISIIHGKRQ